MAKKYLHQRLITTPGAYFESFIQASKLQRRTLNKGNNLKEPHRMQWLCECCAIYCSIEFICHDDEELEGATKAIWKDRWGGEWEESKPLQLFDYDIEKLKTESEKISVLYDYLMECLQKGRAILYLSKRPGKYFKMK